MPFQYLYTWKPSSGQYYPFAGSGASAERAAIAQRAIALGVLQPLLQWVRKDDFKVEMAADVIALLAASGDQCRRELLDEGFIPVRLQNYIPAQCSYR